MPDMAPVAPGIAAWGLMTGVAMVNSVMSIPCAVLMTLTVFAGSSQLAAIPLLASGAPMWVILATGFCLNLRFVIFSAHFRPYMMSSSRWQRMIAGYLSADITFPTEWGLGFAGVLALVGVTCSLMNSRMRIISAVTSATAAIATYALPLKPNIVLSIACAVCMCVMI
ncbi:MAG: branched-chain amino acid ABC transporter permease [Limnohabitans sp.]|nr:branched-chain amino acid ABC transporter permease [Limnohabitans sp.]